MSENVSSNKSINTESISAIEKTLKALNLDLSTKKQQIEIIRNLIHNDKTIYNSEIKKYSELNQQIIRTEQEIENIDKQISSLIGKQKLFHNSITTTFYYNFKDTYHAINNQSTIAFFQFCGFEDADKNKCDVLKQIIKNENELLNTVIQAEKYQKDLYETKFNKFKAIKTQIISSNKGTLPYVYEQLFIHIKCVYDKIELNSQKEGLIQVNELNYEEKNKIFILLKKLEYSIVKNSKIYKQLYAYIKGVKTMLVQYNSIKTNNGSRDITIASGNNSVSNSNNYGIYMNFIKCVREFRKTHWHTNLYLNKEINKNKMISQVNGTLYSRTNNRDDEDDILSDSGEGPHYTDQNMSILSEFGDDQSEISSINRDLIDTTKNMDIIYRSISVTKKHIKGLYKRKSPQIKKQKRKLSKMKTSNNLPINAKPKNKLTRKTKTISNVTIGTSLYNTNHLLKSLILNHSNNSVNTPHTRTRTRTTPKIYNPNLKKFLNTNVSKNINNQFSYKNFGTLINSSGSKTPKKKEYVSHTPIKLSKSKTFIFPKEEVQNSSHISTPKKITQIKCISPSNGSLYKNERPKSNIISRNDRIHKYVDNKSSNNNQTFQMSSKADNCSLNNISTQTNLVTGSYDKSIAINHISNNNLNTNVNQNEEMNENLDLDCVCDEMLNIHNKKQLQLQMTKMSFLKQNKKFLAFDQSDKKGNVLTSSIKIDPKKCGCCMSCT